MHILSLVVNLSFDRIGWFLKASQNSTTLAEVHNAHNDDRFFSHRMSLGLLLTQPRPQIGWVLDKRSLYQLSGLEALPSEWMARVPSAFTMMSRVASGKCAVSRPE